jgi:hypothetical protein
LRCVEIPLGRYALFFGTHQSFTKIVTDAAQFTQVCALRSKIRFQR